MSGSWGQLNDRLIPSPSSPTINSSSGVRTGGGSGRVSSSSGGGGGGGDHHQDASELFARVTSDIEAIASAISQLKHISQSLRGAQNLLEVKDRVVKLETNVERNIKSGGDTLQTLHAVAGTNAQTRQRLDKLSRQYKLAVAEYRSETHSIISVMKQEGQRRLSVHSSSQNTDESGGGSSNVGGGAGGGAYGTSMKGQITAVPVQIAQQEERLQDLQQLESDLAELGELFENVALLAQEQGTVINQIEVFSNESVAKVQSGVVELETAKQLQKSARKKMCCIICCLVCSVVIFLSIFGGVFHFQT